MTSCASCGAGTTGAFCATCGASVAAPSPQHGSNRTMWLVAVLILSGAVVAFAIGSQSRATDAASEDSTTAEQSTAPDDDPDVTSATTAVPLPANALQELQRTVGGAGTTGFVVTDGKRPYGITLADSEARNGGVTNVTIWTYDSVGWHQESLLQTNAPAAQWSQFDATGDGRNDLVLQIVGASDSATQVVTTDSCAGQCWEFATFIVDEPGRPGVGRTTSNVVEGVLEPAPQGPSGDLLNNYKYCIPSCADGASLTRTLHWIDGVGFEQTENPEGLSG
jgi:hypothetical protein